MCQVEVTVKMTPTELKSLKWLIENTQKFVIANQDGGTFPINSFLSSQESNLNQLEDLFLQLTALGI